MVKNSDQTDINNESKKNNNINLIICFSTIILVLLLALIYFAFIKDNKEEVKEEKCNCEVEEKKPTTQYINYNGTRYTLSLDWTFTDNSKDFELIKNDNSITLSFTNNEETIANLLDESIRKEFLEKYQEDNNIKINKLRIETKDEKSYIVINGIENSYSIVIVMTEANNGINIVKGTINQNNAGNKLENEIIKISLTYHLNNK